MKALGMIRCLGSDASAAKSGSLTGRHVTHCLRHHIVSRYAVVCMVTVMRSFSFGRGQADVTWLVAVQKFGSRLSATSACLDAKKCSAH
jgi:hypothetical protein